jgi:hypothetical protein
MSLKKAREILGENLCGLADSTQTVIVPNHHASLKIGQDFKGTVPTYLEILGKVCGNISQSSTGIPCYKKIAGFLKKGTEKDDIYSILCSYHLSSHELSHQLAPSQFR